MGLKEMKEELGVVHQERPDTRPAKEGTPIMKYFVYEHLPPHLKVVSQRIAELANYLEQTLPAGPEKTTGLRKLLEAKDCFVRTLV